MLASEHLGYWHAALAGADPSPLPAPAPARPGASSAGELRRRVVLPAAVGEELHRIARRHDVRVRALLIAAHLRLLGSLTSNPHVMSAVVAGRGPRADLVPLWL